MKIKSIAVFCGSKSGNNSKLIQHTNELGAILADKHVL